MFTSRFVVTINMFAASPFAARLGQLWTIRAFSTDFLQTYVKLPETPFELVESVDMMRLLEHGHRVLGVPTDGVTFGVDHAVEADKIVEVIASDPAQKALYDKIIEM